MSSFKQGVTKFFRPARTILLGFAGFILLGALCLMLPAASASGESIGFLDALFQATSAVCVTGLTVRNVGRELSVFGQVAMLVLIQMGGLGFMTMASMVFMIMRKRITLRERVLIQESMNEQGMRGMVRLIRWTIAVTLLLEAAGTLALSFRFVPMYGPAKGMYFSVFHAVSAFCNAGFDILGTGDSLTVFRDDPLINITIMVLITLGGLGFAVMADVLGFRSGGRKKMMLHTKVVLIMSALLFLFGLLFFLVVEWENPATLGQRGMHFPHKLQAAAFQSVTLRTAGFNTVDQGALRPESKLVSLFLMFVGASPASTGGGVKTTTFAIVLLMLRGVLMGRDDVRVFRREIPFMIVRRAFTVMVLALGLVIADALLIALIDNIDQLHFLDVLFEVFSAFGTVGISANMTAGFSTPSRLVLIFTMFIGRVGPMTLTLALAHKYSKTNRTVRFPEEYIMVG